MCGKSETYGERHSQMKSNLSKIVKILDHPNSFTEIEQPRHFTIKMMTV